MRTHRPALWWSDPALTLPVIAVPVALVTYLLPPAIFAQQWGAPKYFDGWYLTCYLACVFSFCIACGFARLVASRSAVFPDRDWRDAVQWDLLLRVFDVTAILCCAAYAAWWASAIARGARLDLVLAILSGSKGAADLMKDVYMVTIPGVTTMTQFGIVTMLLGCLGATRFPLRRILPGMAAVMGLALVRAVLNSERLALIELVLPTVVLACHVLGPRLNRFWWFGPKVLSAAPVAGVVAVFCLFSGFEYFRSWVSYFAGKGDSFLTFAFARFSGYYATSLNNGAFLADRLSPLDVPFFSLPVIWKFPVLKQITADAFPSFSLLRENSVLDVFARGANPEFNNGCGILLPYVDLGLAGAMLYWAALGLAAGAAYSSFLRMRLPGLLSYPILFIGIVEAPRIIYTTEGRAFPAWAAVLLLLIASKALDWRHGRSAGFAPSAVTASPVSARQFSGPQMVNQVGRRI
ncbi:MAG: hypothetical protein R2762_07575 [Bryobacteraceae bacterium]